MPLRIRSYSVGQGSRQMEGLALDGRLDSTNYQELESALEPILASPVRYVVFDLANLTFISSAGIRVCLTTRENLKKKNGVLILANVPRQIGAVLDIAQATPGISIFNSEEEIDQYLEALQKRIADETL